MIKGIDVSHYNKTVDFAKAKSAGHIAFVYVKATEGANTVDPMFKTHMTNAMKAGLPVGCYHFARPKNRPEDEAANFIKAISQFKYNLLPVLDLEWAPAGMTSEQLYQWARKFIDIVKQKTGHQVILYTGVWFLQKFPALKKLNDLLLWISIYGRSSVPINLTGWKDWAIWQFTETDMVPGVGTCDSNYVKDLNAIMVPTAKPAPVAKPAVAPAKPAPAPAPAKPTATMYRVLADGKFVVDTAYPDKIATAVQNAIKNHAQEIVIKPRG